MSTINETQRKYLRLRLEAIHKQKEQDINNAIAVPSPWDGKDKGAYVKKLLDDAGLTLSLGRYADYVQTDIDRNYDAEVKAAQATGKERRAALRALYNRVMDDIILGDDADVLRSAIDSLNNFSPTGATN